MEDRGETRSIEDLSRRKRRFAAAEITAAATRLFSNRGFDNVTVDDIAAAAGISRRTFFRYFATKEELLVQHERRIYDRLCRAMANRPPEEGPVTALRNSYLATASLDAQEQAAILERLRFLADSPDLLRRVIATPLEDDRIMAMVAARMGTEPTDPRVQTVVAAVTAVTRTAWHAWLRNGKAGDLATCLGEALEILENGLRALDAPQPRSVRSA